ncbi:MAG: RNA polymerase Rpb6 [Bacteroidales bacterium]|jgi:16S rRNA C1402 (ribose-2'-O) methylase RsmI|nr:RNA polymerase Rpb6 [Bacteroidales bacterium]
MTDYKKAKVDTSIQTHDLNDFNKTTGNIYETLAMLSKRSDQIAVTIKKELIKKIEEFAIESVDNLEEVFDNHERIEVSRYFESLPKPCLIAINEYLNDELIYKSSKQIEAERESKN